MEIKRDDGLVQLRHALLSHAAVADCAILLRSPTNTPLLREPVAYVVASGPFLPERLHSHLQSALPGLDLPCAYVPIASLPLTAEGALDTEALSQLEVIDAGLVSRWEEQWKAFADIAEVAVVVQEEAPATLPLHLSDVLPSLPSSSRAADGKAPLPLDETDETEAELGAEPYETPPAPTRSLSEGPRLVMASDAPRTLPEALLRAVKLAPEKEIVYLQSDGTNLTQSYADLLADAERILGGLRALGAQPGAKVLFQLEHNQDFIPAFWGCVLGGLVPVPLSIAPTYEQINSAISKLHNAWILFEKPLILTGKDMEASLCSLPDLLHSDAMRVVSVETLRASACGHAWHECRPEDVALLLLTSGSTGMPKGVVQRHSSLLARSAAAAEHCGYGPDDVSLNWFPMDHVGGIVMFHLQGLYVACRQIHAPTSYVLSDPLRWLDLVERYCIGVTWAPNFAYALINARAEDIAGRKWDLSSLWFILNAGEAIVSRTARRFLELLIPHGLPPTSMRPAWGMSETCSAVTYSDRFTLPQTSDNDAFVEVGAPIPGFSMRIVDARNQLVEEGMIGRLEVKGPSVTVGYYNNAEVNQEVFTADGWFNTGDLGMLREGRLTITGRQKDVIIVNGVNFYSHELESVVEEVPGVEVSYTAACAVRSPGSETDELAIFFHTPEREADALIGLLKAIRGHVVNSVGINPKYLIPVDRSQIPKTQIGKIQRSQLRSQFEAGEFRAILKQLDIWSDSANTLPDWFYRPVWRRKAGAPTVGTGVTTRRTLVFVDRPGLGDALCDTLTAEGLAEPSAACIRVEAGSAFSRLSDTHYCIAPSAPSHYRRLLEAVVADGGPVEQIVHLWTYAPYAGEMPTLEALEHAQELGIYSLLGVVQAVAEVQGPRAPVRLLVVSSHTQATRAEDVLACERTPLLGLVKAVSQETVHLTCTHLDLPAPRLSLRESGCESEVDAEVRIVLAELGVTTDREVAYRDGHRLGVRLERVDLVHAPKQDAPFKMGGMYLLSGGLGGIGIEVARYLLSHYNARLLLLGRSPLSARLEAYQSLLPLGGEICYKAVDVCDMEGVRSAVAGAEEAWGRRLEGVLHLAGLYHDRLLAEETPASVSAAIRSKVGGSWTLAQLLKERPECIFIGFSSLFSFFDQAMAAVYAGGNRYLDSLCHSLRQAHGIHSTCFGWSGWNEIGMNRSQPGADPARLTARGFQALSSEQAVNSLLAGLYAGEPHLLVGLDGSNPYVRRHCDLAGKEVQVQRLCAYFTYVAASSPADNVVLDAPEVWDRYGATSACECIRIPEMPRTDTGEIDREQLTGRDRKRRSGDREHIAPRTEAERCLAEIWQKVLGVSHIGVQDNFFELGGHSLLAAQIFDRIEIELGKKITPAILFQKPTIEALATVLEQQNWKPKWKCLAPIRPTGTRPPFFWIHHVAGDVLYAENIVRHMSAEIPVYGLQSLGLDGSEEPLIRIEEMAELYLMEMVSVQPKGPFYLGSYSFGCAIALEIAQQLLAQRETVGLLVMLDPPSNYPSPHVARRSYLFERKLIPWMMHAERHLLNFRKQGTARFLQQQIKALEKARAHQANRLLGRLRPQQHPNRRALIWKLNLAAQWAYQPRSYPGRITYFYAAERHPDNYRESDTRLVWSDLAESGLEVHLVPGHHNNMAREPHVRVLTDKLNACLKRAYASFER